MFIKGEVASLKSRQNVLEHEISTKDREIEQLSQNISNLEQELKRIHEIAEINDTRRLRVSENLQATQKSLIDRLVLMNRIEQVSLFQKRAISAVINGSVVAKFDLSVNNEQKDISKDDEKVNLLFSSFFLFKTSFYSPPPKDSTIKQSMACHPSGIKRTRIWKRK